MVNSSANIQGVHTSGQEVFTASAVASRCTASESGVAGSTTIDNGTLQTSEGDPNVEGDETVVRIPMNPAPNTTYEGQIESVGDRFRYVFNEQVIDPNDGSITVHAAHLYLLGPTAVGDLFIGTVECGVTGTGAEPTTTAPAPTTTAPAPTTTAPAPTTTAPAPTTTAPAPTTTAPAPTTTAPATTTTAPATTLPVTTTIGTTTTVPPTTTTTVPLPPVTAHGTGLIINGGGIAPADCPPGGGTGSAPGGSAGLVTVGAVTAACTLNNAQASAVNATIGGGLTGIELGVIQSECTTGPGGGVSSSVLVISGGGVLPGGVISQPITVNLGLLSITLNEVVNTPTTRGATRCT